MSVTIILGTATAIISASEQSVYVLESENCVTYPYTLNEYGDIYLNDYDLEREAMSAGQILYPVIALPVPIYPQNVYLLRCTIRAPTK